MRAHRNGGRPLSPSALVGLWALLVALGAGAWLGLPSYVDSLERRIVFRSPDCMDVAAAEARRTELTLAVRGDSLEAWTRTCLEARQEELVRHADRVGIGVIGGLLALSGLAVALTLQSARLHLRHRGRPRS